MALVDNDDYEDYVVPIPDFSTCFSFIENDDQG